MKVLIHFIFNTRARYGITPEIKQILMRNMLNGKEVKRTFKTRVPTSADTIAKHKIVLPEGEEPFSISAFNKMLKEINANVKKVKFITYDISRTYKFLEEAKIPITSKNFIDVQDLLRLTKLENKLATEGSDLQTAYFIAFNKYVDIDYSKFDALSLINQLYDFAIENRDERDILTVFPYGFDGGMPFREYFCENTYPCEFFHRENNGYETLLEYSNIETNIVLDKEINSEDWEDNDYEE